MDQWLKDLYSKNRFLFWVVIPFCALFILFFGFKDLILKIIVDKSNEELSDAKVKDASLSEKEAFTKQEASTHAEKSREYEKKIGDIEEDEDWNKKRKGSSDISFLATIFFIGILYIAIRSLLR
jgi:hypothetical protein